MEGWCIGLILGCNATILGSLGFMWRKIGKLEGRLTNGDYMRCPFYKRRVKGDNNDG